MSKREFVLRYVIAAQSNPSEQRSLQEMIGDALAAYGTIVNTVK